MYEADDFIHPFSLPEILFRDIRDKFRDKEGIQGSPQKSIRRISEKKKEGKRCYSEMNREYNAYSKRIPKEPRKYFRKSICLKRISGELSKEPQKNFRQIRCKHEWYSVFLGEFHTKSTRDNMSFSLKSRSAASNKSITYI